LQQLALRSPLSVMPRANQLSSTSAKVTFASVSLLQNAYLDFGTLFQLVQRSQCKQDLQRRF
jgi:hypothetical protein